MYNTIIWLASVNNFEARNMQWQMLPATEGLTVATHPVLT